MPPVSSVLNACDLLAVIQVYRCAVLLFSIKVLVNVVTIYQRFVTFVVLKLSLIFVLCSVPVELDPAVACTFILFQ